MNGNNGFGPYERYAIDGGVLASVSQGFATPNAFDENSVALVQRGEAGAFDLVSAGTGGSGISRVRKMAGDTLSTIWTEYASGGALSTTAPSQGYALHSPIEVDVDGDGVEDVVFGSDDGYLYAVKSTDGSLVFSVNLSTPVDYVIAANVDQDPALELVAGLADGRLLALDEQLRGRGRRQPARTRRQTGWPTREQTPLDATVPQDAAHDAVAESQADSAAGSDAEDAGGDADAGSPSTNVGSSSGCGCRLAPGPDGSTAALIWGFAAAAALVRRRRK